MSYCVHQDARYDKDQQAYARGGDLFEQYNRKLYTPKDLLATMCNKPKSRFELSYPVYRVRGPTKGLM